MAYVRGGIQVKSHVQLACDALKEATGVDNFGTYNGHSPPEGPTQAVDIFNPDNASGHRLQDRICTYALANAKRFGIRYVIRREHIWNIERASQGWRRQAFHNNRTADHYDHVHITFYGQAPGPFDVHTGPLIVPIPKEVKGMFMYSTAPNVDQGSIWLVIDGKAFRFHVPNDVQRCIDKGVVNFGEMSEAFHNLFEHNG